MGCLQGGESRTEKQVGVAAAAVGVLRQGALLLLYYFRASSCMMQKSMRLEYELASELLHNYAK